MTNLEEHFLDALEGNKYASISRNKWGHIHILAKWVNFYTARHSCILHRMSQEDEMSIMIFVRKYGKWHLTDFTTGQDDLTTTYGNCYEIKKDDDIFRIPR